MLRVDVTKQLGEFSLEAAFESQGRVTGLFGASGAGKTSLINMIAGLLRPDRGVIALDGETLCFVEVKTRRSDEFAPVIPQSIFANNDRSHERHAFIEEYLIFGMSIIVSTW